MRKQEPVVARPAVCKVCKSQPVEVRENEETQRVPGYYGRLVFGGKPGTCPNHGDKRVDLEFVQ